MEKKNEKKKKIGIIPVCSAQNKKRRKQKKKIPTKLIEKKNQGSYQMRPKKMRSQSRDQ